LVSSRKLIFIHGWGTTSAVWQKQIDYFSGKYTIEVPDLPFAIKPFTSDHRLATSDQRPATILIGWSYGGMCALRMASQGPDTYKALVLVGTNAVFADEKNGMPPVVIQKIRRRLERDYESTMAQCYATFFSQGEAALKEKFIREQVLPPKTLTLRILDELMGMDMREVLPVIAIPTLIIHGDKDEVCPLSAGAFLHRGIRRSRLEVFKGCGHMPFYTRGGEFNTIVDDFIKSIA